MQSIRSRILETLKEMGQASAASLAARLNVPPVTARYHLDILQGDNLVTAAKVRRPGAVGRPQQFYSLTAEADAHFPDNFVLLTTGVVRQLKQMLPAEEVEGCFRTLAEEMAQPLVSESPQDEKMDERMQRVVSFLNERGYLARWEQETGQLHTHNCPYAGVSSEHRELCCMDLALIESLSGRGCEVVRTIAEGGRCCSYQMQVDACDLHSEAEALELSTNVS